MENSTKTSTLIIAIAETKALKAKTSITIVNDKITDITIIYSICKISNYNHNRELEVIVEKDLSEAVKVYNNL